MEGLAEGSRVRTSVLATEVLDELPAHRLGSRKLRLRLFSLVKDKPGHTNVQASENLAQLGRVPIVVHLRGWQVDAARSQDLICILQSGLRLLI